MKLKEAYKRQGANQELTHPSKFPEDEAGLKKLDEKIDRILKISDDDVLLSG